MARERPPTQIRADQGHAFPSQTVAPGPTRQGGRERTQRCLEILRMLAAGQEWGARNLSETFDVTQRTIQRDMLLLENAGLVFRTGTPRRVSYRLAKEASFEHPLFTLSEVISLLSLAGRMPSDTAETERATTFAAVAKLAGTQPSNWRAPLEQLVASVAAQEPALQLQLCGLPYLSLLIEALVGHRALKIGLRDASGSAGSEPIVLMPNSVEVQSGRWVVTGYKVHGHEVMTVELQCVDELAFDVDNESSL